jgi:hypothetical protein
MQSSNSYKRPILKKQFRKSFKKSAARMRIDGKQFYRELCELCFASEDAAKIASWIKTIFETKPAFLSVKKPPW